jgi:hypothetical protein
MAFLMALEVGGAVRSMNCTLTSIWPEAACVNEDILWLNINPIGVQGIIVDKNGQRFSDESLGNSMYGSIMIKLLPDTVGLMVIDELILENRGSQNRIILAEHELERPHAVPLDLHNGRRRKMT